MALYQTGEVITVTIYPNEIRDGDSFLARDAEASREIEVRLYGIDAPEGRQRHGDEARECLRELVKDNRNFNMQVMKVTSSEQYNRDRVIGLVYRESPFTSLSHEMVRRGWAYWYHHFDKDNKFNIAEVEIAAKQGRLGIWEDDGSELRPWDYRMIVTLVTENMDNVAESASQAIRSRSAELAGHLANTVESIATQAAHIRAQEAEEQVRAEILVRQRAEQEKEEAVQARLLAESRADDAERRASEAERREVQEREESERRVQEALSNEEEERKAREIAVQDASTSRNRLREADQKARESELRADEAESQVAEAERRATEADLRVAQEREDAEKSFDEVRAARDRESQAREIAEQATRTAKVHREILAWAASFLLLSFVSVLFFNSAWMLPHLINTAALQLLYFLIPGVFLVGIYLLWSFFFKNLVRSYDQTPSSLGEDLEDESDSIAAADEEKPSQD